MTEGFATKRFLPIKEFILTGLRTDGKLNGAYKL
jgi:hypothetical protein